MNNLCRAQQPTKTKGVSLKPQKNRKFCKLKTYTAVILAIKFSRLLKDFKNKNTKIRSQ